MIEQKPQNTPGYTLGDLSITLVRDGKVIGLVTQEYANEVAPTKPNEAEPATSQQGINQVAQPHLSPPPAVEPPPARSYGDTQPAVAPAGGADAGQPGR